MDIPSLFMIPSAVSSGKVHSVFPNSTDADFDFNRDSSATRVNSQGLIETVGYFSTEKLTGFTNGTTYAFTTFITSGNNITSAIVSSAFAGAVSNAISVTSGQIYRVTFDYTKNSGNDLRVVFSSSANGAGTQISNNHLVSSSGSYSFDFTITSTTTGYLQMGTGNSGHSLNASISNVSVKEIQGDRARLNYEIEGGLVNTKPSLLLEPQSTNLLTYSENFLSSLWTVIPSYTKNAVVTKVNSKNPYGTYESYQYKNVNQGEAQSQLGALVSASIGATYTSSIYIRRVKGTGTITFRNINNGTNDITSQVTSEWKRFTTTATAAGSVARVYINLGTEGDIIEVFGAQLEQQSYATSYIPTNGSTQTRAAETCNGAGTSSIFNDSEGILYCEIQALANDTTARRLSISDGTTNNGVEIGFTNVTNEIKNRIKSGGSTTANLNYTATNVLNYNKIAFKFKVNDFAVFANGQEVLTDTSGAVPTGLSELAFDRGDGTQNFYGKIRDIRVYNTKEMTDSEVDILLTKITS